MVDGRLVLDVVEASGCGDDWVEGGVPVRMCSLCMKFRSRADCMSPRKMEVWN